MQSAFKLSNAPPDASKISRAQQRERSKAVILNTAIRLFAERGYSGVSLDELAGEAGVRRTLLLYYFKSKDELWRSAATEVSSAFNASLLRNLASASRATDADRLHATLAASLEAYLEEPDFPRFLVREGGKESPRLHYLIAHFNYAKVNYSDEDLNRRVGVTIVRDLLFAILLSMAALGPLMEVSLSRVSGRKRSGIHPISKKNKRELVDILTKFVLSLGKADTTEATPK